MFLSLQKMSLWARCGRSLTQHEEGRGHVDADEGDAEVDEQPEGGHAGQGGAEYPHQPQPGLGLHAIPHGDREQAEEHHDADGEAEVGHHGVGVVLQLRLQSAGGEEGQAEAV